MLAFAEQLCTTYDLNRGFSPDPAGRITRDEVIEYIDAHSIDKPPDHPTTAIHWDLVRTFGESEGRRLLLQASESWDARPLRARDIVFKWWEDDYEPQAWVDEYLLDLITGWRLERDRLQVCANAQRKPSNVIPFPSIQAVQPLMHTVPNATPLIQSAAALRAKTFNPIRYVVPGYLAEGCTILAGRPKVGKSWFMLDVGIAVASGGNVLGAKAEEGDVLYLGLEDNERRLKSRIGKILGPFVDWPKRFSYATVWKRAHEGGLDDIRNWIASVSQPRLIVVDVLARFRAPQTGQNGQYEADYQAIAGLQAIASEKNIALVIVHHLRKSAADSDPFDKVSGTLGLSGAADTVLILDRDGQGTALYGRGRDIEEIETAVTFDRSLCRWQVLGAAADVRKSDERKTIIDALRPGPMSRSEIALATGMLPNNADQLLWKMVREGDLNKVGKGCYGLGKVPGITIVPPPY